jgi:hypothetical protein
MFNVLVSIPICETKINKKTLALATKYFPPIAQKDERLRERKEGGQWSYMALLADEGGGGVEPIPTLFLFQSVNHHV